MWRIRNESRLVALSKCCNGIKKDAFDLSLHLLWGRICNHCVLPSKNVFSSGHTCFETISDHFVNQNPPRRMIFSWKRLIYNRLNTWMTNWEYQFFLWKIHGFHVTRDKKFTCLRIIHEQHFRSVSNKLNFNM